MISNQIVESASLKPTLPIVKSASLEKRLSQKQRVRQNIMTSEPLEHLVDHAQQGHIVEFNTPEYIVDDRTQPGIVLKVLEKITFEDPKNDKELKVFLERFLVEHKENMDERDKQKTLSDYSGTKTIFITDFMFDTKSENAPPSYSIYSDKELQKEQVKFANGFESGKLIATDEFTYKCNKYTHGDECTYNGDKPGTYPGIVYLLRTSDRRIYRNYNFEKGTVKEHYSYLDRPYRPQDGGAKASSRSRRSRVSRTVRKSLRRKRRRKSGKASGTVRFRRGKA